MDKKKYNLICKIDDNWNFSAIQELCKKIDDSYNWGLSSKVKSLNDLQDNKNLADSVPESFCIAPFRKLQIDPDGRAKPCCKYNLGIAPDLQDDNYLPKKNIDELWNQDEFTTLRHQFMNGEKPVGCKICWEEESDGITSLRLDLDSGVRKNPLYTLFTLIPSQSPDSMDLKLSNLCNLKCRICNPFLSSQWIKEHKDLNLADSNVIKLYTNNSKEKFFINDANQEILKTWSPNLKHIEFFGGEPLLQQEHESILKILIENSKKNQISLCYNTNVTQLNESFFKYWQHFKHIFINFSVDDINKRFEYQRKNALFTDVAKNLARFTELSKIHNLNYEFTIYCSVGILNVFYLPEFFEEMSKYNIPFWLNIVHYPAHYNIQNLPRPAKEVIRKRLETIDSTKFILHNSSITINHIINYMMSTENKKEEIDSFFLITKRHDEYRDESFQDIFPELNKLFKFY